MRSSARLCDLVPEELLIHLNEMELLYRFISLCCFILHIKLDPKKVCALNLDSDSVTNAILF